MHGKRRRTCLPRKQTLDCRANRSAGTFAPARRIGDIPACGQGHRRPSSATDSPAHLHVPEGGSLTGGHLAHPIGHMPAGLGGGASAGFSLEVGNGFNPDESIRWGGFKQAGSLTVSVDTRFGPLFFATGTTRSTGSAPHLFLGPFG